jgi:PAS domain S-box-containing protein
LLAVAASAALLLPILIVTDALGIAGGRAEVRLLYTVAVGALIGAGLLYLLNRYVSGDLSAGLFVLLLIALIPLSDNPAEVVDGRGLLVFALPIVAASVLLRPWAGFVAFGLSAGVIVVLGTVVVGQAVPNVPAILALFVLALIAWLSSRHLERALDDLQTANERLQESEAQYRGIVEASSDAIFVVDMDGHIVEVNPAACELYGYTPGALRALEPRDLVHPDDHARFDDFVDRIPQVNDLKTEFKNVRQDGEPFDVEVRLTTFEYRGSPHLLNRVRDISDRKRMERTLRERVKELTCLYAVSRDVQADLSLEELCRRIVTNLRPALQYPEIAVPMIELDGQQYTTGGIDGTPVRTLSAEIAVREMTRGHVSVSYVEDQPFLVPEELNLLQSLVEILGQRLLRQRVERQRRVAHEALAQQLAHVELFNQIARAIAARYDAESILQVVAQRLEEGFADQASVWLRGDATNVYTLASAGDRGRQAVERSGFPRQLSLDGPTSDHLAQGTPRYWPNLTAADAPDIAPSLPLLDIHAVLIAPMVAGGEVIGILVTARRQSDAYERQERDFLQNLAVHVGLILRQAQLRQEIQNAYDDLRETQLAVMQQERLQALGEMASGIAHDINNAIAPLPLYTGMLKREPTLSAGAASHVRAIETAVSDVEETVARMRQFYRRPEETEALVPLDLNAMVSQAIELTRPRWRDLPQERGVTIDLRTDLQDDLPLIAGLKGEIRQAVINLIFNAVDAMPEGGTLTLRTRERPVPPPHVVLAVSDTGIGMDEETRRHCLEPFYTTKGVEGSGMGLATVYGTMQRHDGDVNIETALGEGTTVQLIFPVREISGKRADDEDVTPPTPLRILCIDDEPMLRQALQEALQSEGHDVALADGGASGLSAFEAAIEQDHPFDVVITDLGMPHVDGREVAQRVKAEAPETAVILLTGWGVQLDEEDLPDAVDLMLGKPPNVETLNRALAQVAPPSPRQEDTA